MSFLIDQKLWLMEISPDFSKTPPVKNINKETTEKDNSDPPDVTIQETTVEDVKYIERFEDFDSKNHHLVGFQLFILNLMHLILQNLGIFCAYVYIILDLLV